jgi:phage gp46-like protein
MDIALTFSPEGDFDLQIEGRDLVGDDGIVTPMVVSLFSDRVARADDPLPEYMPGQHFDRRGWWGDLTRGDGRADPIGSRLWLLHREKELPEVVARATEYVTEALKWVKAKSGESQASISDEGKGRLKIDVKARLNQGLSSQLWTAFIDLTKPGRVDLLGVK